MNWPDIKFPPINLWSFPKRTVVSELITVSEVAKELGISSSHAYKLLKNIKNSPRYISTTDNVGSRKSYLYNREELVEFFKNNTGENKPKGIYKAKENTVFFNDKVENITSWNKTIKKNARFKKRLGIKDKY